MILPEFADRIASLISGGMETSENRFDRPYLYALIHSASAQAKVARFMVTKRIPSSWLFPYYPEFNEAAQISACYYKFKLPQIIALSATQTGLGYIGSIDCNCPYRVVENRARFAAMQQHRVMKNMGNTVLIGNGTIELYGDAKKLMIEGMWYDVTKLPNFSIEKDPYPIDAALVPEVEKIISQIDLSSIARTPIDTTLNAKDDSAINKKP